MHSRARVSPTSITSTTAHKFRRQSPTPTKEVHPGDAGLVIGNRDMEANAVSVRIHGQGNLGAKPQGDVIADLLRAITQRSNDPSLGHTGTIAAN